MNLLLHDCEYVEIINVDGDDDDDIFHDAHTDSDHVDDCGVGGADDVAIMQMETIVQ